jgi:hypothetical protein
MILPGFSSRPRTVPETAREALTKVGDTLSFARRPSPRDRLQRRRTRLGTGLTAGATALTAGATALAAGATALAVYRYGVLPWHRTWGATDAETEMSLPGDGLVPRPAYETTRAVTIEAPPAAVWPWIVQMGQGRAGFYSYDWLENLFGLEIHNADRIHPEWQDLAPGDTVRLAPPDQYGGRAVMRVVHLDPNRALVFGPAVETLDDLEAAAKTGAGTWAFVLHRLEQNQTRLIVRTRSRPWTAPRLAFTLYDPTHFLMERKMLLGIKERAERTEAPARTASASDDRPAVVPARP